MCQYTFHPAPHQKEGAHTCPKKILVREYIQQTGGPRRLKCFNGTTTGIDNVNISGLEDGSAWYTISGIRVNRPAAKGVYIHNGRKVIVK